MKVKKSTKKSVSATRESVVIATHALQSFVHSPRTVTCCGKIYHEWELEGVVVYNYPNMRLAPEFTLTLRNPLGFAKSLDVIGRISHGCRLPITATEKFDAFMPKKTRKPFEITITWSGRVLEEDRKEDHLALLNELRDVFEEVEGSETIEVLLSRLQKYYRS